MDAARALTDLMEISSQVRSAAIFGADGAVAASTFDDDELAGGFARRAAALREAAGGVRPSGVPVSQLEVATADGSVFVVRDGERTSAATTSADPTVGLVFYDLKSCLRDSAQEPKPKRKKKASGA